jgi:AcrR family transcriptional regulator
MPPSPSSALAYARPDDVGQVAAILDAAEACFARAGYAGAAMREIAEGAGVAKSLLHYHFQSKEHLFVEVQMRAYERLAAQVAAAALPVASGQERGLRAFDALVAALREGDGLRVQAELWAGALSNAKLREHVTRLREFFRELLIRTIREILGPDLDRAGVTAAEAADLVWATINGVGLEAAFSADRARGDGALRALRTLAAIALAAPASPASPASPRPSQASRPRPPRRS